MFEFFNSAIQFFNDIFIFITSGIYQIFIDFLSMFVIFFTTIFYLISSIMMQISWDIAKSILSTLNISALVSSAWSSIDSQIMTYVSFFRLPEAINNVLSAFATRLVMKFTMPWY